MFGNNLIKIDFDTLENAIKTYNSSIETLTKAKSDIKNGISSLEGNWTGEAKSAYFNVKYADWDKGLEGHISRMKFLRDQLIQVRKAYTDIMDEGGRLQNKL